MKMKQTIILLTVIAFFLSTVYAEEEHYYNTTDFGNQSTYSGIFLKANEYTHGWFGTGALLGFLIITFFTSRKFTLENKDSATVALFLTAIIGILMIPLGIIKVEAIVLIVICFVIGLVTLFL